jgi:hypothetical protein
MVDRYVATMTRHQALAMQRRGSREAVPLNLTEELDDVDFLNDAFVRAAVSTTATGAENWAALIAAATDANGRELLSGRKHYVWVTPGSYAMDASTGHTTNMRVYAIPGTVKFINAFGDMAFDLNQLAQAVGPYVVSAIAEVAHPSVSGTDTNAFTHRIALTTVGDAVNFQRGDAVVIGSSDARTYYADHTIPYPSNTVNYLAEAATVEAVDTVSGYVYLAAPLHLWSLFATSIQIRRLSRTGANCEIIGIDFDTATDPLEEDLASGGLPTVNCRGLDRTVIRNCRFLRTYHAAIDLYTCARSIVEHNEVHYAPANGSGRFGYGTSVQGASYGNIIRFNRYEGCRHGVTIDGYSGTTAYDAAQWYRYGDARGTFVYGNVAIGCTGAAFDSHEPSIDTLFMENMAIDTHRPAHDADLVAGSANPAMYQIRGRNDSVIGGVGSGNMMGIVIMSPGVKHEKVSGEGGSGEGEVAVITVKNLSLEGLKYNNGGYYAMDIWGSTGITAADQVCVQVEGFNVKGYARGLQIRAGVNNRVKFVGGNITGYDITCTFSGNGNYSFIGTHFDAITKRTGEGEMELNNSSTCVLNLINVTVQPNSSVTLITAASGVNATLRHYGVINMNPGVTLTMTGGAGTVTKVGLTATT